MPPKKDAKGAKGGDAKGGKAKPAAAESKGIIFKPVEFRIRVKIA